MEHLTFDPGSGKREQATTRGTVREATAARRCRSEATATVAARFACCLFLSARQQRHGEVVQRLHGRGRRGRRCRRRRGHPAASRSLARSSGGVGVAGVALSSSSTAVVSWRGGLAAVP